MKFDRDKYGISAEAGPIQVELNRSTSAHIWVGGYGVHIFFRPGFSKSVQFERCKNWRKQIDVK